jgi:dihydrofolate reductase
MSKVTCDLAISLDGFVAGPNQSLAEPFGEGVGERLHRWMFDEPDANAAALAAIAAPSAYVMGRNMFGPGRGAWDLEWEGWWGEDPPYHAPVFVLTHHAREPLTMQGGTVFTFVTDGIESALAQARQAAGSGGGRHRGRRRDRSPVPLPGGDRRAAASSRAGCAGRRRAAARRHRRRPRARAAGGVREPPRHAPEVPRRQVTRLHTQQRSDRSPTPTVPLV